MEIQIFYAFHIISLLYTIAPTFADVGLSFVKSPEAFIAPLKDEVVFECSLNVPPDMIKWRKDWKYLNNSTAFRASSTSHLNINFTNESQIGDYQCVAWFGASALASIPAHLSLAEISEFEKEEDKNYEVTCGNMIAIKCPTIYSNPSASIQYYHNGKKLSASNVLFGDSNTLILNNVTTRDSGIYSCTATNYFTEQTVKSHTKTIVDVKCNRTLYSPKFLFPPQSLYVVQTGSNITIECVAVGEPPPNVTWRRIGKLQSLSKNRADLTIGGLNIRNVNSEDRGEYVCEMANGVAPSLQHKITLRVQEAPVITKEPNSTLVEEHGDTQLTCEATGDPSPQITWTLNAEPLRRNDSHITIIGSRLLLKRAQKKHAGIYQCFVSNVVGVVYGYAMVQVKPKQITEQYNAQDAPSYQDDSDNDWNDFDTISQPPAVTMSHGRSMHKKDHQKRNKQKRKHKEVDMVPPTAPNVTRLSDRSVMVRWHVPPNDGLPISFFKVQYREVGTKDSHGKSSASKWMTSNEDIPSHIRSYEIDRLETNRTYRFRIAAAYSNNDNKLSENSNKFFLHEGAPTGRSHLSPPTLIHAEAISPTGIAIQWQYLNSVLTPVDGFYVYYRATSNAGDYIKSTVEGENVRSYVITHLSPDTSYDIKIQSFTVGAASDFSSIISHKTQVDPTASNTDSSIRPEVKTINMDLLTGATSSTGQLLFVFGGLLAAIFLIFFILVLICFIRQRSPNHRHNQDDETMGKNSDSVIHQLETVNVNGFGNHNGKIINNTIKSPLRNGYISSNQHINITSNPLSTDPKHDKNSMETSYISRHNNNCSTDECSSENETNDNQPRSRCESSSCNKWKMNNHNITSGENYV